MNVVMYFVYLAAALLVLSGVNYVFCKFVLGIMYSLGLANKEEVEDKARSEEISRLQAIPDSWYDE